MKTKPVCIMAILSAMLACGFSAPPAKAQATSVDKAPPAVAPCQSELSAKVEEYMQASVRNDAFSGNILIARDGLPIVTKSYGMANYELNVPNTPQTVFGTASLTKAFTAMAIMQLQEKGRLKVGDPICRYLTDCPAAWQPVTIHHLLTHTSGIENFSSLDNWDEVLGRKDYRPGELVSLFRDLPLEFAPGDKYQYSNSGYHLLGQIIERTSGKSYKSFLQDNIFAPLGMTHSSYDLSRMLKPNRATGYYSFGTAFVNAPPSSSTHETSDGGIYTTVGDLLLWDQAHYSEKLISRKSLEAMFIPFKNGYGYGWQINEKFGRKRFDHAGAGPGWSSYIARFPADRVTVIVLGNSDELSAGKAGTDLAAITFGEPYKLPAAKLVNILWDIVTQKDVERAKEQYLDLRRTEKDKHDFTDETLVTLGYNLFEAGKLVEAKAIFDFTILTFPKSAYSYDGLADIAESQGDKKLAVAHFEKSLTLDPENEYAVKALARLRESAKQ